MKRNEYPSQPAVQRVDPEFTFLFRSRLDPKAYDDRFVLHGGGVFVVCHLANSICTLPDAYLASFVQESAVPDREVQALRDGPHGTGFYPTMVGGMLFDALNINLDWLLPGCRQVAVATDGEALAVQAVYEAASYDAEAVRTELMPWFTAAAPGGSGVPPTWSRSS